MCYELNTVQEVWHLCGGFSRGMTLRGERVPMAPQKDSKLHALFYAVAIVY